ncbi:MAG: glycosyltransferase, partial [Treponema sp.]|nr:glycosyltransferase [Treponema sp.]
TNEKIHFCNRTDFENGCLEKHTFDIFFNGSAHRLKMDSKSVLNEMYPESIMKICRYKAVFLHDFIPLFFQDYIWDENQKISFALQNEFLRFFDCIFVHSHFTAACATRYIPLETDKIFVMYGGIDEKNFSSGNSFSSYSLGNRKNHIVYVGGFAPQKNWRGLTKAFCMAVKRGLLPDNASLYIVCSANQNCMNDLKILTKSFGLEYGKNVVATGFISDAEMKNLISTARASIFPSFLEGLGLPILESYAAGTPCWASGFHATKDLVLPECSFNPFDEESIVQAISDIYKRTDLCSRSLEFGRGLLNTYSWDKAARKVVDVFESLAGDKTRC